jgi:glycosyltransferase involved in cell wall biosynthesis
MQYVTADIRLLIGGSGPDASRLKELAAGDQRIVFLGQLTDQELIDYYADALAVPFVPFDEDYGLITIEAMKSGKPVITTTDSGGVLEFVRNDETGLVANPDPRDIARAINYMCNHRVKAREMGLTAKASVSDINWSGLAVKLIGIAPQPRLIAIHGKPDYYCNKIKDRRKMVVAVTFPIHPPRGGGQARIYHLYREWSKNLDITIVSLTGSSEPPFHGEIAPGLFEIRVPKSIEHELIETEYSRTVEWIPVSDIVAAEAIEKTPQYLDELEKACKLADIVVASHPYLVQALLNVAGHADLWYEAQDTEYSLKEDMLPSSESAKKLLHMVRLCEEKSWKKAKLVFACTAEDIDKLEAFYGPTEAETIVVPNGFSVDDVSYADLSVRRAIKEKLGIGSQPTVIFMGSWHGPNLDAVERIFEFADAMPSVVFLIVGSAGLKFQNEKLLPNIRILGVVDEAEKRALLGAADLAINPMTSGSGSNLKMLDYFAAGLPVLSTPFGARGIDVKAGAHYLESEIGNFISTISMFFVQGDNSQISKMCTAANEVVHLKYSWHAIANNALNKIGAL